MVSPFLPLPEDEEAYLLVDGYNIIFAWEELRELALDNMDGARGRLMDLLCNYQAIRKCCLMVVFDAYRVAGHATEVSEYHNIQVVYTKEAETADQYIEKFAHENARRFDVSVATSDGVEQVIILGQGCRLISARELKEELDRVNGMLREEYLDQPGLKRNRLYDILPEEVIRQMREAAGEDRRTDRHKRLQLPETAMVIKQQKMYGIPQTGTYYQRIASCICVWRTGAKCS